MFLETRRLILRRFREGDFEDFCAFAMDDDLARMMGREGLATREEAWGAFRRIRERELRGYALVLKETGRVIGQLTVTQAPRIGGAASLAGSQGRALSFSISRHHRRMGLTEEALRAVIRALFAEGMDYVQCGCFDFNTPSAALQKKLGFEYLTTERLELDGENCTAIWQILWK